MSLQNLSFYIEKLYLINKELGGSVKEGYFIKIKLETVFFSIKRTKGQRS